MSPSEQDFWVRISGPEHGACIALVHKGGSTYGPNWHRPPLWQINHANSAYLRLFLGYFQVISATRPSFESRPPHFYISWIHPWVSQVPKSGQIVLTTPWASLIKAVVTGALYQHAWDPLAWSQGTKPVLGMFISRSRNSCLYGVLHP